MSPNLTALVEALRPKQWTKNAVVFAAIVFDGQLFEWDALAVVAISALLFSLTSSAGYLFNDLRDLDADRQHPVKQHRPIAAGRLDARTAWIAMALIYAVVFPISFFLSPWFAGVLLIYVLLMLAYSRWLKNFVILDVFVIASGFVLRVVGGAVVVDIPISPWLYVCTVLLALFIGFAKRRHELSILDGGAANHRRNLANYSVELLDQFILLVAAAALIAYSLYTFEAPALPDDERMMLTIPFVVHGIFRYLYLVHQKGTGGAPEHLVLEDRPLLLTVVLWGLVSVALLYGP
ncbi:MAG: decaprenyl-phosphate phosphoribosyltransferase [Thermomicrobiaceae bacterium]